MPKIRYYKRRPDESYFDHREEASRGRYGTRLPRDRRYWVAWSHSQKNFKPGVYPGVIDDFGNLVAAEIIEQVHWD